MLIIRDERDCDFNAREDLLDHVFGSERHEKTCERLRDGQMPACGLSLVAEVDGRFVGTVRLWSVKAGDRDILLLGPLAVDGGCQSQGIGSRLMRAILNRAAAQGHKAVILVGDAPYYTRFGFSTDVTRDLDLPGPVDRSRFLGLELQSGALRGAQGLVVASGERIELHPMRELDAVPQALLQAA